MDSAELIKAATAHLNCTTYKLATTTGITSSVIYGARAGKRALSERQVIDICKLIKMDPALVLPGIVAERSKRPEKKKIWERVARLVQQAGTLALCGFALIQMYVASSPIAEGAMYIMSNRRHTRPRPIFAETSPF